MGRFGHTSYIIHNSEQSECKTCCNEEFIVQSTEVTDALYYGCMLLEKQYATTATIPKKCTIEDNILVSHSKR